MIKKGAVINLNSESPENCEPYCFPLMLAARSKDERVINLLLSNGADVNIKTCRGWTALHLNCRRCDRNTMKLLLRKDADITIEDKNGMTPFGVLIPAHVDDYEPCLKIMIKEISKKVYRNLPVPKKDIFKKS